MRRGSSSPERGCQPRETETARISRMPLLPDDEARIRLRFADLLPRTLDLSGFPPGWNGCLEKFLKNVEDYRKWAKHHVSLRELKVTELIVIVRFYGIPTNNKHLTFIVQVLKRHVLHSRASIGWRRPTTLSKSPMRLRRAI